MTRAFSDAEKEAIRERLLAVGLELFSAFGLKKTSIDEIAAKAGISKGSFYNFYKSKEILLWDVINNLEKDVRMRFVSILTEGALDRERMYRLFLSVFHIVNEYPIIRRLLDGEDYHLLVRALPAELVSEHLEEDYDFSQSFVQGLAAAGVNLPGSVEASGALLRSLFFIALHRNEIGKSYEQGIDLLCRIMADAFITEGD